MRTAWEKFGEGFPLFLDACVNFVARIVMIVAIAVILLGLIQLSFSSEPSETRASKVIVLLHSNWRALLILPVPLFYPAIRRFVEEVQEIGMVRRSKDSQAYDPLDEN